MSGSTVSGGAGQVTIGTSPFPPVSDVSPGLGTTRVYVGDTFVTPAAASVTAGTLTVYVGPTADNGADFEVLVTDVTRASGFHPSTLLFQSGTLTVPALPLTRVPYAYTLDLGGLALQPGHEYAWLLHYVGPPGPGSVVGIGVGVGTYAAGSSVAFFNGLFAPGGTMVDQFAGNNWSLDVVAAPAFALELTAIPCFVAGTRIATPGGMVAVEALRAGDMVLSRFGGSVPVRWVGSRRARTAGMADPGRVWPIRIEAGALGPGVPCAPLYVSADHALFLDGVLVPAGLLVNGMSIRPEMRAEVTYHHVELAQHDVLLAEGAACESYLDVGNRGDFDGVARAFVVSGETADEVWRARACAPQCRGGARLAALRGRLARRALGMERERRGGGMVGRGALMGDTGLGEAEGSFTGRR